MPFLFLDADHCPTILNPCNLLGDLLHTLDGDVCQYAGGSNFKLLLVRAEYVFGVAAHASQHVMQQRAMLHVNQELQRWYLTPEGKQYEPLSYVNYTTLVGSEPNNPCISAKGMQSRTLFMFSALVELCGLVFNAAKKVKILTRNALASVIIVKT